MRAAIVTEEDLKHLSYAVSVAHVLIIAVHQGQETGPIFEQIDLDRIESAADALERASEVLREMSGYQILAAAAL